MRPPPYPHVIHVSSNNFIRHHAITFLTTQIFLLGTGFAFKRLTRYKFSITSGCNRASTLIIHNDDALWRDLALGHFERRRECAIGE